MKVLVIGGGGREHALVWKILQSPQVTHVCCAPGNAGIALQAECVDIAVNDIERLVVFARDQGVGMTVVGPEEPLVLGVVDRFQEEGLPVFGVTGRAAQLEGSKAFAKKLMENYGIPTADFEILSNATAARDYVGTLEPPFVVKADGLAAGKGVFPCRKREDGLQAVEQIMVEKRFGSAGERIVVESFLEGEEASFLAITDGDAVIPFPSSQDHKAIFDGDKGPNTGGMGAYSPAPVITPELHDQVMERIMIPTVRAMNSEGRPYRGILYAGLMVADGVAKVLEFNVRFGDPEAQPLLMRLDGDLVNLLQAAVQGRLHETRVHWDSGAAVCVVMASGGYPGPYPKGKPIRGLEDVSGMEDVMVFHAGTALRKGRIVTNGGRVLGVTARGSGVAEAVRKAYDAVQCIHWDGAYFRKDIGKKALERGNRG
jgi:phosphoribosylamine--glycine ligase